MPLCALCHELEGAEIWVGDGGSLAYVHGIYQMYCKRCVLKSQIAFLRKQVAQLPELERQLAAVEEGTP